MKRDRRRHKPAPAKEARGEVGSVREGATLEVEIERIVPGGAGLAHAEGRTLFVALAAPGDRARVRVERVRGRAVFASIVELLAPSPARVEPPCPYFGRCGGCDFQQLTYESQLAAKVEIIRDCLRRIARLDPPAEIPITPSPQEWRYRSRARWQFDQVRRHLGYYELASHRVCDVAECPVVVPEVQRVLDRLRALMREGELPAAAAEFQAAAGDDGVSLAPPLSEEDAGERERTVAGERYRFDADCFFQINHALLDALVGEALKHAPAEEERASFALDLYSGVGLFTLPLARRHARVAAVEGNARACAYARRNLASAGLDNAEVHSAPVGEWLRAKAPTLPPVELLLLDPPRAGAEPETIAAMIELAPRRVSYVSCDPATLARDLRALTGAGYTLDSLAAFDMFPQTHHVETVARLSRAPGRGTS